MKMTPDESHSQVSIKLKMILLIFISCVIFILPFVYFTTLRPTDRDIQSALSDVTVLKNSVTRTMPAALKTLSTPVGITPEVAARFKQRVETFTNTLLSLEHSNALQRSFSTLPIYTDHKSELAHYGQSLSTLSKSVSAYGDLLTACNDMIAQFPKLNSRADFDTASATCEKAVLNKDASPDETFNKGFFNDYREKAQSLIDAYKQYFIEAATKNSVKISSARIAVATAQVQLGYPLSVTINYTLTAPSSDIFTKLTDSLNKQKDSLIR